MEMKFCQSCGMPLQATEHFGTNADGSINEEYCVWCYKDGAFTSDCTMEEMIAHCVKYLGEFNAGSGTKYTEEEAIAEMRKYFPTLKRWANKG